MSIEAVTQAPAAAPAPPAVDTSDVMDFGQREHMVLEAARAESLAEAKADAASDDGPLPEGDEVVAEVAAANDKPVAPAAPAPGIAVQSSPEEKARKASLANAARLERESVRRSTELASKAAELKLKEQTFVDREAKLSVLEKAYNDPDALISLLSEKVSPEKMAQFFIESGQPDKVAERRAKAAQEPVSAEIKKLQDELKAMKDQATQREESDKQKAARAASEKDFASRVLELKSDAPSAARLLNKRPQEFFAMADMAAKNLMAAAEAKGTSATWDDVILDVNKQLEDFAKDLQDEAPAVAASSAPEKPTKKPAAAQASTVSNRVASERSAVLGEDDKWESLSFDERVRRAEKRVRVQD